MLARALVIVLACISATFAAAPTTAQSAEQERITMLNKLKERYQSRRNELARDLREKAVQLSLDGMGVPGRLSAKERELQDLLQVQFEAARTREDAKTALAQALAQVEEGKDLPAIQDAVNSDPQVRALRERLAQLHVSPKQDEQELRRLTAVLDDERAAVRAKATAALIEKLRAQAEVAERHVRTSEERVDAAKKDVKALADAMKAYLTLKDEEQATRDLLTQVNAQLEQLAPQPARSDKGWQEQFGSEPVSLYLSRDALAKAEPSLKDVTYAGSTEIDGRRFIRFKNASGEWLIDASTIAGVHRAPSRD